MPTISGSNRHVSVALQPIATDATPSAPRNLMASPMPTSIQLTWDAPLFIGNLTHYSVECGGITNRTIGTERTFTFTNLTPETQYHCAATAVAGTLQGQMSGFIYSTTTTPGACTLSSI